MTVYVGTGLASADVLFTSSSSQDKQTVHRDATLAPLPVVSDKNKIKYGAVKDALDDLYSSLEGQPFL